MFFFLKLGSSSHYVRLALQSFAGIAAATFIEWLIVTDFLSSFIHNNSFLCVLFFVYFVYFQVKVPASLRSTCWSGNRY